MIEEWIISIQTYHINLVNNATGTGTLYEDPMMPGMFEIRDSIVFTAIKSKAMYFNIDSHYSSPFNGDINKLIFLLN
jgi:hypothetical protein